MEKKQLPLRRFREELGLTQLQLALQIGVDRQTVGSWERGSRFPQPEFRVKLAHILGKSLEDLELANMMPGPESSASEMDPRPHGLSSAEKDEEPQIAPIVAKSLDVFDHVPLNWRHEEHRRLIANRMSAIWMTNVMAWDQAVAEIAVQLRVVPSLVISPWDGMSEQGRFSWLAPSDVTIMQIYDACNQLLLITGEPGAGKTTLLLTIGRELLHRASDRPSHPLPVLFNLSSWATQRFPLELWMIEELATKYHIPRTIAQFFLKEEKIIPLLDGLDEVEEHSQSACIQAINSYRREHGLVPMAICSRIWDYSQQPVKLHLMSAVEIQPLHFEQVETYLATQQQAERAALLLQQDHTLRTLVSTPLMLMVLLETAGEPDGDAQENHQDREEPPDLARRRQRLFERYVSRVLQRKGKKHVYTKNETLRWLAWLAFQLRSRQKTEFRLEEVQSVWLNDVSHSPRMVFHFWMVGGGLAGALDGLTPWIVPFMHDGSIPLWVWYGALIGGTIGFFGVARGTLTRTLVRWQLWRTGAAPFSYRHFLDFASNAILLQKIAPNSYTFRHHLLLEFFATLAERSQEEAHAGQRRITLRAVTEGEPAFL